MSPGEERETESDHHAEKIEEAAGTWRTTSQRPISLRSADPSTLVCSIFEGFM